MYSDALLNLYIFQFKIKLVHRKLLISFSAFRAVHRNNTFCIGSLEPGLIFLRLLLFRTSPTVLISHMCLYNQLNEFESGHFAGYLDEQLVLESSRHATS